MNDHVHVRMHGLVGWKSCLDVGRVVTLVKILLFSHMAVIVVPVTHWWVILWKISFMGCTCSDTTYSLSTTRNCACGTSTEAWGWKKMPLGETHFNVLAFNLHLSVEPLLQFGWVEQVRVEMNGTSEWKRSLIRSCDHVAHHCWHHWGVYYKKNSEIIQ